MTLILRDPWRRSGDGLIYHPDSTLQRRNPFPICHPPSRANSLARRMTRRCFSFTKQFTRNRISQKFVRMKVALRGPATHAEILAFLLSCFFFLFCFFSLFSFYSLGSDSREECKTSEWVAATGSFFSLSLLFFITFVPFVYTPWDFWNAIIFLVLLCFLSVFLYLFIGLLSNWTIYTFAHASFPFFFPFLFHHVFVCFSAQDA